MAIMCPMGTVSGPGAEIGYCFGAWGPGVVFLLKQLIGFVRRALPSKHFCCIPKHSCCISQHFCCIPKHFCCIPKHVCCIPKHFSCNLKHFECIPKHFMLCVVFLLKQLIGFVRRALSSKHFE